MALSQPSKISIGRTYGGWTVKEDASAFTFKPDTWLCFNERGARAVLRTCELLALVNRNRRMGNDEYDESFLLSDKQLSKVREYCSKAAISVDLFIFEAIKDKLFLTNPNPRKGWSAKEYGHGKNKK